VRSKLRKRDSKRKQLLSWPWNKQRNSASYRNKRLLRWKKKLLRKLFAMLKKLKERRLPNRN
jgi:hypothetical protein